MHQAELKGIRKNSCPAEDASHENHAEVLDAAARDSDQEASEDTFDEDEDKDPAVASP